MKHKNPAITETLRILVGMLICLALMLGVYALIQKFILAVLFGGLVGTVIAVGNFFFMAIGLSNLADDAEEGKIKIRLQGSFLVRTLAMMGLLVVAIWFGKCDPIATILPLLFVRPILTVEQFILKSKMRGDGNES